MRKINAAFFDLDDTLYSCSDSLADQSRRLAAEAMVKHGLAKSCDDAVAMQIEMADVFTSRTTVFRKIVRRADREPELADELIEAYNSSSLDNIKLLPGAHSLLKSWREKGLKLFLITDGIPERQAKKIAVLGLRQYFDDIVITNPHDEDSKEAVFLRLMREHNVVPRDAIAIGDRIDREIRAAKRVGITTVQMVQGDYRHIIPINDMDKPTYKIAHLADLDKVIFAAEHYMVLPELKIVAFGGGTGLPILLDGLRPFTKDLTAIVTVTDSGRSTGMIRQDYELPAPGDLRNCLIALSESNELLRQLFQFRFDRGTFEGMSFGNLFLTALTQITGSFEMAVREASSLLKVDGRVLPSSLDNVHLFAELDDGRILEQEHNVRTLNKISRIKRLFVKPEDARPLQASLSAIAEADMIVLGPGSLLTSVIPNLLINGLPEAIGDSPAKVLYVMNVMTQPGQTDGFNAIAHVECLRSYMRGHNLDGIVVNTEHPAPAILKKYMDDGAEFVEPSDELRALGIPLIEADMLERPKEKRTLWNKQDLLRHDPAKLAATLYDTVRWEGILP
ncbi:MAG: uridine diphosphate-N-acetylglucosamine-binding protein YvcK [Lentisphaerae bacterium]|nr:uridine diphosphate-N-acetylglucosamine-binding protein YvcK [Lentisphaerota bacterium]